MNEILYYDAPAKLPGYSFAITCAQNRQNCVIHYEEYSGRRESALKLEDQYDRIFRYLYFHLHLAGRLFMNIQAAPVIYAIIAAAAFFTGRWKYHRLQVGN